MRHQVSSSSENHAISYSATSALVATGKTSADSLFLIHLSKCVSKCGINDYSLYQKLLILG